MSLTLSCAGRLLPLLLIGSRPDAPAELQVADSATWALKRGAGEAAPRLATPVPGEDGGWRFEFSGGARRGYAEVPLDGDRLQALGFRAVRLEYRTRAGEDVPQIVLTTAAGAYRAPLSATGGAWARQRLEPDDFTPDSNVAVPPGRQAPRRLRVEPVDGGLSTDAVFDVRSLVLECDPGAAAPWPAGRASPATAREGFLRGPFLVGGNRTLLDTLGEAGGNVTVEYTAEWPRALVREYLESGGAAGVRVIAALSSEVRGRVHVADHRLAPLAGHPALAGWYLYDEPDGATDRGMRAGETSAAALAARAAALAPAPVLVVCLNSIGLQRYARCATLLATDYYLPAYEPAAPLAIIHSDAEAVVETAAGLGAVPTIVLQLDLGEGYAEQDPASLRAQAFAALAAGVRGILGFEAAAAARAADSGAEGGDVWGAFLSLCGELSAIAPLAEVWTRVPGEPSLGGETGDVRASCFLRGDETWIVLVNLARGERPVRLGGACLDGARRLREAGGDWSAPVRGGAWKGTLAPLEARLLRVDRGADEGEPPRVTERVPLAGVDPVRFDRALVGATLFPAPDGPVRLFLDGVDRTADANLHAGPAVCARLAAEDLADGEHAAALTWEHAGAHFRDEWTFRVAAPVRLPFRDDFDREAPGALWAACDSVPWNLFSEDRTPARGSVTVESGELRVVSREGGMGAVLRSFEAPSRFRLAVTVRLERPGRIEIARGDLRVPVDLPAGRSRVEIEEAGDVRVVRVDGEERRRERLPVDHRRGAIGLGVAAGTDARFDDLSIEGT